ncbi:unnamed protein product [Phytophthora lilii]|uniref:Unnamed protein product n=1 Tax=Phytophthora lilii TaxID=2077276 RepID=A0A9W6X175_9STRA|nr:unnamed protein product [Phytophthora lilii]
MVADGTHFNGLCCVDYGNAETKNLDDGATTMEAIYTGNSRTWSAGQGVGPWVIADLENGLFGCADEHSCPNAPTVEYPFLVAMLKGRSGGTFALKLQTTYDGARPRDYEVMKKQGAIILGIGGNNNNWAEGSFYEGVMVSGNRDDAVEEQVQANIVAAGYGSKTASATHRNSTRTAKPRRFHKSVVA